MVLAAGCGQTEPQTITLPVTVEECRAAAAETKVETSKSEMQKWKTQMEVAEAVAESRNEEPDEEVIAASEQEPEAEAETNVLAKTEAEPEPVQEIVQEPEPCIEYPEGETGNYYEDLPDETSEVWQYEELEVQETGMQYLGVYYITHYSAELCRNAIGAAEVPGGLVEGTSIAVPEYWMLGHWFYIENHGTFRADDISDGPFDIFHWYTEDAVGADYQNVWLVG